MNNFTVTRTQIAGIVPRKNDWISGLLRKLEFRLKPDTHGQTRFYSLSDIVVALRERGIQESVISRLVFKSEVNADA